ncbi:MAG TPA: hypothetical protein VG838_02160 [Opitutaceae bacterium]|nr:hypothetical protein [Opitutaceae bacterium]
MSTDPASTPTVLVPMERTVIFPKEKAAALLQAACFFRPQGITGYWTPTEKDLRTSEVGLEDYLKLHGRTRHDSWTNYRRQVAGVEFDKAQLLFMSYFSTELTPEEKQQVATHDPHYDPDRWKKEPFWMNDGGEAYFRVIYDLPEKQFIWYERNNDP